MPVFMSYSRRDETVVKQLVQGLEAARRAVWFDHDLGGGDIWWKSILDQIQECTVFVFALSDASMGSKPCLTELEYAKELRRPVLPVQVGPAVDLRTSPFAEVQVVRFDPHDATSAFAMLAAVDAAARSAPPLPEPLPERPPIPFAYLLAIGTQMDSTQLSPQAQQDVVEQLRRALLEETDRSVLESVVAMLKKLDSKPYATKRASEDIAWLLNHYGSPGPTVASSPSRPSGRTGGTGTTGTSATPDPTPNPTLTSPTPTPAPGPARGPAEGSTASAAGGRTTSAGAGATTGATTTPAPSGDHAAATGSTPGQPSQIAPLWGSPRPEPPQASVPAPPSEDEQRRWFTSRLTQQPGATGPGASGGSRTDGWPRTTEPVSRRGQRAPGTPTPGTAHASFAAPRPSYFAGLGTPAPAAPAAPLAASTSSGPHAAHGHPTSPGTGAGQPTAPTAPTAPPTGTPVSTPERPPLPREYWGLTLLAVVLTGLTLGAPALYFSWRVGQRYRDGDVPGARRASTLAKGWGLAAVAVFGLVVLAYAATTGG